MRALTPANCPLRLRSRVDVDRVQIGAGPQIRQGVTRLTGMQRIVGGDPEQIGRQLAHLVSVALGKSLAPPLASPGSVAGRSQLNTWTAYEPPRTTGESTQEQSKSRLGQSRLQVTPWNRSARKTAQ
jgi:hypothetical protein